jgi:menaquinone reductase, multiheme cytochrome c subunit
MTHHDEAQVSGHDEHGHALTGQELVKKVATVDYPGLFKSSLPFFIGLLAAIIIGWGIWPTLLYSEKAQPIQFNHVIHTEEAGMSCEDCHSFRDDGQFTGLPSAEMCLDCHTWSSPQNEENDKEKVFLENYVTEDDELKSEIPWYVYSKQPDCVFFSHIAHVEKGGLECAECHGNHGETTELRPYYENRLTRYSRDVDADMKMTDCAACHEESGQHENNACFVCHK